MRAVNLFEIQFEKRDYGQPHLTIEQKHILANFEYEYFNNLFRSGYKEYEYNGTYLTISKILLIFIIKLIIAEY